MSRIDSGFSSAGGIGAGFGSTPRPFGQGIQDLLLDQMRGQGGGLLPFPGEGEGPGILEILQGLDINVATDKFAFSTGGNRGSQLSRQLGPLLEEMLKNMRARRGENQTQRIGDGGRSDIVRTDPSQPTGPPISLRTPMFDPNALQSPVF